MSFFGEMSYLGLPFTFWIGLFFVVVELYKLFVYFGNQSLVACIACKYFLPFCVCGGGGRSFGIVNGFLCCEKGFEFN